MDSKTQDRISGAILGAACGGSLGGCGIELSHKDLIAALSPPYNLQDGLPQSYLPNHKQGNILADVYLALNLAESVIANKGQLDINDLKKRFAALLEDQSFLASAPGASCLSSIRCMADDLSPEGSCAIDTTHMNGSVRAFPLGCLPAKLDHNKLAVVQAQLTHSDSRVWAAAAVIADTVFQFINGLRLDSAVEVRDYVSKEFKLATQIDARFAESWDDVAPDLNYQEPADKLPYSLVNIPPGAYEAIPSAVGIFLIFRHDLEAAISNAAISGGNTDSIATIVGALSGAYHGASSIPKRWLDKLSNRSRLEAVVSGLVSLW